MEHVWGRTEDIHVSEGYIEWRGVPDGAYVGIDLAHGRDIGSEITITLPPGTGERVMGLLAGPHNRLPGIPIYDHDAGDETE